MDELGKKQKCCCFTGHRPEKLKIDETTAKQMLKTAILQAIYDGYTTFLSGMARGIDIWAAEIVLELKKTYDIYLVAVSPYYGFERNWSIQNKKRYADIIDAADKVKFMSMQYNKSVFYIRNVFMVDNCSRVIAAYNGGSGGTKNTIEYAKEKGNEIVNIINETE